MKRAILAGILVLTVSMAMTGTSWASDSVKMILSSPAGGNAGDLLARKVAYLYKQRTGKEMPVLNVTGGNHIPAVLAFNIGLAATGSKQSAYTVGIRHSF